MRILLAVCAVVGGLSLFAGCGCLEGGKNGVPDPEADEYQLVFNNIVSRETEVFVDGVKVCEVCAETEFATVGNFPAHQDTLIVIHSLISDSTCHVSPRCDGICDGETCTGDPLLDTTPFAGRVFNTGLIWLQ